MSRAWRAFVPPPNRITRVFPLAAIIQPVARTESDPQFGDPSADTLVISKVPQLHTVDAGLDAGADLWRLGPKPRVKVIGAVFGNVVDDPSHRRTVA